MKKLILIFIIAPFLGYGQVTIDRERLHLFLDYISSSMSGGSSSLVLYKGQKAFYASDYDLMNIDGSSEIMLEDYTDDGVYKYVLHNKRIGKFLGIDFESFEGGFIFSSVFSKNSNKNEPNNIISVDTQFFFMRRNMNNIIANDIETKLIDEIDRYFKNRCTTGIANRNVSFAQKTSLGYIDKKQVFEIIGSDYVTDKSLIKQSCSSCNNCYIDFEIGFQTSGVGIDDGYSHILHIQFTNKINYEVAVVNSQIIDEVNFKVVNPKNSSNKIDLRDINLYDLTAMINFFLLESNKFGCKIGSIGNINASFETLKGNTIALSYGINNNDIILKVDPEKWAKSSTEKKWYILYHELGHDVLNLSHGQGGKMMFNFADRNYSWKEFNDDKKYMFRYFKNN